MVHKPAHHLSPPGQGVAYTTNWSGYADKNATFTDAKGSWVQPAVSCTSNKPQYSSFWVGIDGYTNNTVEQIGTDSDCVGAGNASYYAWYEMYPAGSVQITNFQVQPGDTLTADVSVSGSSFTLTLKSSRSGTYTTTLSSSTAAKSSAEWVAEAPMGCFVHCSVLPLANFGTVNFSGSYTTGNGTTGPINDSAFSYDKVVMVTNGGTVKATPSGLTTLNNQSAFSDTWHHS